MLRPKKMHTRTLITKQNFCHSKIPHSNNFSDGLFLRADNPTHPLLIIYHIFLDPLTHLFWWCSVLPFYPTTFTWLYDWLILLIWGSLELLQGTFLYVISGRGLVNNNCQENGINGDNYCNGRIRNLIEETLKMAIVRTWFFVWKKSPAYLFNHEERQNPTEVDLFGQINTCTS